MTIPQHRVSNPGSAEEFAAANKQRFAELSAIYEAQRSGSSYFEQLGQPATAEVIQLASSQEPTKGPNATS